MPLFFLFILIPVIEIALFIKVGGLIGLWPTIALVLLSAVLLACGLVLDTVTRGRIEAKRLAYLAIPATRGRQRAHREAERGALAVQAGEGVR